MHGSARSAVPRVAVVLCLAAAGLGAQVPDSAAIAALARSPDAALPFDPRARMRQLPNGLRYYIRTNARPEKRAELRLVVNAGSVIEDDDQLGLAHVVEHMCFNGTQHFARTQIVDFIEHAGMKFGADLNAGTTFDETIYQLQVPSDTGNYVGRSLDWFADIAGGGVTFDSIEVEKERPVVIEEWRLGRGPNERIQQQQLPVLFRNSRYASRLPIGTKASLDAFTRAQVVRFYRDWYRPDLMAVIVVGDVNADSVESMIKARFSSLPGPAANERARDVTPIPPHAETLVAIATDSEAPESNVGVLWPQPVARRTTVRSYARDIAEQLFLAMLNDRLDEITHKPNAPFTNAAGGQGRLVRASESFSLSAIVPDGGIERGLAALMVEGERARRFGFTAPEFERERSQLLRSLERQFDERDKTESGELAGRYVDHFLTGDPVLGIEVRAPLVRALLPVVTIDSVNALARDWLVDQNRVILAAAPLRAGMTVPTEAALRAAVDRAHTADVTAYTDLAPDATLVATPPTPGRITSERKIDALNATVWTLSNGAHVIVKPTTFQADEVLISGLAIGGVGKQTPERFYSAMLAPVLLEAGGAGRLDADALNRLAAGKIAVVSASIDQRAEGVSGRASPKDLGTFFEMLWARLLTPRLDTAAITALKQQYTAAFKNRGAEPTAAYADTIGRTMTMDNPLARPLNPGIVDSLDGNIALDVFRDRFRDFSNFTFIIVGAVQPNDLKPLVERWLAALPGGGRTETPNDPGIRRPSGAITKVLRKGTEPKAQETIVLTGPATWTRDAAMRAEAISEVLTVRMRQTLREDLGGTYNVAVGASIDRWPVGAYIASVAFGAAPERIDSLTHVALGVLRRFAAEGPTRDELNNVRENLNRTRETALTQNDFWVSLFENQVLWGDDVAESVQSYKARVAALDPDSVRALAKIVLSEANIARFTLLPEGAKH